MKEYLNHKFNADDPELVSIIDELPLWSAPFGLRLLDNIILRKNINALDIGCGLGFPMIEISQRLGKSAKIFGIDPWDGAIQRTNKKINKYLLNNVKVIKGVAEKLPFENSFFDLIVSNNGINNVEDMKTVIMECYRVCRPGAQFVFTMNLENTMNEFYCVFEKVLRENRLIDEIIKMKNQIYSKRKPVDEVKQLLIESGFVIRNIGHDEFCMKFIGAEAMFNHSLIKY